MKDAIGWISSLILILTIGKQVYKQWSEGTSKGVSTWLFAGQIAASVGFAVYSWLVRDWVFIFTNSIMVMNGIAGLSISLYQKRRENNKA
jgi:MtN3 and saliva related transmembrane protein